MDPRNIFISFEAGYTSQKYRSASRDTRLSVECPMARTADSHLCCSDLIGEPTPSGWRWLHSEKLQMAVTLNPNILDREESPSFRAESGQMYATRLLSVLHYPENCQAKSKAWVCKYANSVTLSKHSKTWHSAFKKINMLPKTLHTRFHRSSPSVRL